MKVYSQLAQARAMIAGLSLKRTGKNSFSKFSYYELQDFLPSVSNICKELGLCPVFSMNDKKAKLKVFADDGSYVTFSSPVASVDIGGVKISVQPDRSKPEILTGYKPGNAQDIQNLGAQITYMRRYLYMMAFDITEGDIVDSLNTNLSENAVKENLLTYQECVQKLKDNPELVEKVKNSGYSFKTFSKEMAEYITKL